MTLAPHLQTLVPVAAALCGLAVGPVLVHQARVLPDRILHPDRAPASVAMALPLVHWARPAASPNPLEGWCRVVLEGGAVVLPPVLILAAGAAPVQAAALAVFIWAALLILVIDATHRLIPDRITWPLLVLGLALAPLGLFTDILGALAGAAVGYGGMTVLGLAARRVWGAPALGGGDVKLVAGLGAWAGLAALPPLLLLAALLGIAATLTRAAATGAAVRGQAVPFGPALVVAGVVMLAWGPLISQLYWSLGA